MTPQQFIKKWKPVALTERATAQTHFLDLCALVGHPDPISADPTGESFTFEKGVPKTGGGDGFADVWKKNFFAWEYKKKKRNLDDALIQLVRYAAALENPPLQVACDTDRFVIRTAWTNAVPKTYEFSLDDLAEPKNLDILHAVFFDPGKLRPAETRAAVTREAADKFSTIAERLQGRGTAEEIAHFVNQLVFCFFANSVKLLPENFFPRLLKRAAEQPKSAQVFLDQLFAAMEHGGDFGLEKIAYFNGGLFDGRRALPLDSGDVGLLQAAGSLDWSQIDPTIFGTLFERFLVPGKRAQIGTHYTDAEKVMMIVEPVLMRPLREEWTQIRAQIEPLAAKAASIVPRAGSPGDVRDADTAARRARTPAVAVRDKFLERLASIRILDPACGSGNFLYLSLQAVKDLENRVMLECEAMGLPPRALTVGPEIVHGIEINPLAAELARTTIWIGDIQWGLRNGIYGRSIPILRKLDSIECRDALIVSQSAPSPRGVSQAIGYVEAEWPAAEFIVGNPPFLGVKKMRRELGKDYTGAIRSAYTGRVDEFSDLVCWWFEKTRAQIVAGKTRRAGLVATNSIRGGQNRLILDRIVSELCIFEAWSDEPWVIDGAAVRVSLICFGPVHETDSIVLDGEKVARINPDLTTGANISSAKRLIENTNRSFIGMQKSGPHDISGERARQLLVQPENPNRQTNSEILKPYINGIDIVRRPRDVWIIDFDELPQKKASLFEGPFELLKELVERYIETQKNKLLEKGRPDLAENYRFREDWWRLWRPRPELKAALKGLNRAIATAEVAKHRVFVWMDTRIRADKNVTVIARDDDTSFGVLQSRFHIAWSLRLGTSLENRPRYTPTTTFETFPFPDGLTPNISAEDYADHAIAIAIAEAAKHLDDLRNRWLNPPDLVRVEPEVVPGFPDRILPKDAAAAKTLRERTLTKLYNQRPQWLTDAHSNLDAAVAAAYNWPADISTVDALAELLELNLSRAASDDLLAVEEVSDPLEEEDETDDE
jgi:type II restriction/modification system DNA methylase subunit YeeA